MQGRVRLQPAVRKLLWHELVRQGARLHGRLVWPFQAPGPSDTGAEDRSRCPVHLMARGIA